MDNNLFEDEQIFSENKKAEQLDFLNLESVTVQGEFKEFKEKSAFSREKKTKNKIDPTTGRQLAPMLLQYKNMKKQYPEHILLFQVGDFYEVFFEDAKTVASCLNIRLTSRDKDQIDPIPMCGVPIHALDNYLPKLLSAGFSCILMSQVEDSKNAKGMVKREITRIITPGVRFEGDGLEERQFNYLCAVCFGQNQSASIAYVDVSVGSLRIQETEQIEELVELIKKIRPSEIIIPSTVFDLPLDRKHQGLLEVKRLAKDFDYRSVLRPFRRCSRSEINTFLSPLMTSVKNTKQKLEQFLDQISPLGISVLDAIMNYVADISWTNTPKLVDIKLNEQNQIVFIDSSTRRNLEIFETRIDGDRKNSLFSHIDYTTSAMGSRALSEWLLNPSRIKEEIIARQDAVSELKSDKESLNRLRELFSSVRDLDRLLSRITSGRATPKDISALLDTSKVLPEIKDLISKFESSLIVNCSEQFDCLDDIREKLEKALIEDPPFRINEGGIFKDGFNEEVDSLRKIRSSGHLWLLDLEAKERQRSGINGLKIRYNSVFGYYIEVGNLHLQKVPADYERKQTLANAERFVTSELKEYEVKMLTAKAKQFELEKMLFYELRNWLSEHDGRIQTTSSCVCLLDVLCSLAHLALLHNYCLPSFNEENRIHIISGRHPVIERVIGQYNFIPNDVLLNGDERSFAVLTGPNMGGKSTYLRQIGLIQLLAQIGSYVPAQSADLCMVDRIFTRIGAADDLSRGDSTFMMEMREASVILRRASKNSLVLIDEIGRGTATSDGLALAIAISEWLLDKVACLTVFATHFHELTQLAEVKLGAFSLSVGVIEQEKEIIFTHRIEEKAASRSYGIEVARLAGLPESLLQNAEKILAEINEREDSQIRENIAQCLANNTAEDIESKTRHSQELKTYTKLKERISLLNPDNITPIRALQELVDLKIICSEIE